ncbi:MAG: hypothetical protein WBF17_27945 [Phycisphaerae bacterium]
MKTKAFDCVEMKRGGSRRVYDQIKGMTREEELAFWQKRTGCLAQRIDAAKRKAAERGRA